MSEIVVTTRDRLMRAWQNSMELVRDYENYSKNEKGETREVFGKFAEDEALHAAKLREMLLKDQNSH